jgi:AAA family ATP:ADP antiporter
VTLFFILNIEFFSFAVRMGLPHVGILFFIWVGFFSVTIIAQFWSFANDIYNKEKGNRLFPIIGIGMTAGAPVGAFIAENLFSANIEPHLMLHIGTVILFISLGIYLIVNRRESRQEESGETTKTVLAKGNGFALVFRKKYILMIAMLFILLNLVNTTGEFILADLTTTRATEISMENPDVDKGAFIGAFYGNFFLWVNLIAVFLQAFVVSRIVKYTGLRGTLLILPFVSLGAYGFIAAGVGFSLVRWGKTAENSTDYSIMNTARQLLWLPTSREEKYKAKQAVDTFFVRVGDVLSAVYVFIGTTWLGLSAAGFAAGNIFLILLWLGVAVLILREHRKLTSDTEETPQQA